MSRGGRTLRSALAAALAAAWPGAALAAKLDKAACANLVSELATITANGARGDLERGPEWAKANLAPDRMQSIQRMLDIDDQLEFRCGGRNAVAKLKAKDNKQGPADKQPDDKQSGQPAPGGAAAPVTPSPAAAPVTPAPVGAPTSPVADPQQRTTAPALVVTKPPVPINPASAAQAAPAVAAPPAVSVPPVAVAPPTAQPAVAPAASAGPVTPAALAPATRPAQPAANPATATAPPASTGAMPPPAASVTVPATPKAPQSPPVAAVTPALPPAVAPPAATPPVAKLSPTPSAIPPTAAPPAPGTVPAAATPDPAAKAAARKKNQRRKPSSAYVAPNEVSPYALPGMR